MIKKRMKFIKVLSYFMILTSSVVDSLKTTPYWFNPIIHNFGNIGFGGKIHANTARFFTKMIDVLAYNNTDIRYNLLKTIPERYSICDFGCGVGMSTHNGYDSVGIDTSCEMINVGMQEFPNKKFEIGNAETYAGKNQFDFVSIFFLFHEVPNEGREKILKNALRISKEGFVIMDISPRYKPSKQMLSGEPYILEYCENIENQLENFAKNKKLLFKQYEIAPGRANIWIITKFESSLLNNLNINNLCIND